MSKLTHLIEMDPRWLWRAPLLAFLLGGLCGCGGLLWLLAPLLQRGP